MSRADPSCFPAPAQDVAGAVVERGRLFRRRLRGRRACDEIRRGTPQSGRIASQAARRLPADRRADGKPTARGARKGVLFWAPRILATLFAIFLSLFALDVFAEGRGIGETILALLVHLIPTYLVVICLVIAWRREWAGAILFVCLAVLFQVVSRGAGWILSAPLTVIAVLFASGRLLRARPKTP